ncbi:C45 family autoproteolytic acyltransferase/hydolase [Natrialba taiwanensis]|uniref:Peptidase C45 acyl-coenzyme A:6-aminopenicillanic acid acyl-transferase n=1 Tax=Natrialba taiwanensis DSM 12281 TaxID=1230458 RepID=M0ADN8_9EURY|nr:C45 family peptidase [Natrialba taiwanensis]ELY96875.1 peptidase C45 acyl-coenzyme A:6-aminopenicillanic acid acyl-transferase [Natrialba taiwanensis DSM 12281]
MQETTLSGSYGEMGRQYGEQLSAVNFSPPPASDEKLAFMRASESSVEEHIPYLLNELRSMADAGAWNTELIKAVPLALTIESGCSVVAVSGERTAHGEPLFGRNYDFYASFAPFSELIRTTPENGHRHIGVTDHWTGRHDGVNEAGLAIGHTFVPNRGEQPGVMFALAARAVLDTCETTEEALEFLERIPHARNTNFLVADSTGSMAIVEASPERVEVTRPSNGFAAITNHFLSESMDDLQPNEEIHPNSEQRLGHLKRLDEEDTLTMEMLQSTLADPDAGACACGSDDDDDPIETLWSWTAELGTPSVELAAGRPDIGEFTQVPIQ